MSKTFENALIILSCTFRPVANRHTLRTLARVGGGASEFFDNKVKSKWEGKVKGQLGKASQPGVSSISVDWQTFGDRKEAVQAPAQIMGLFSGCRQVIYGFVPNCTQVVIVSVLGNFCLLSFSVKY